MAANFSEIQWAVFHTMQDMERRGIAPDVATLCKAMADWPAQAVRRALCDVIGVGEAPEPEPGDDAGGADDGPGSEPLGVRRCVDTESRRFNVAVFKAIEGYKGVYGHLSVLTGLSPNALKCRANEVRNCYPPGEVDPFADTLSPQEQRYYEKYSRSCSPGDRVAIREWLASQTPQRRAHPDRSRFRNRASPE